jgi:hypothetical protein
MIPGIYCVNKPITPLLRVAGFEDEDDDQDSLPDEASGSIITPAEKSASQARLAPKIG